MSRIRILHRREGSFCINNELLTCKNNNKIAICASCLVYTGKTSLGGRETLFEAGKKYVESR